MPGIPQIDRLVVDNRLNCYAAITKQIDETVFLVQALNWKTQIAGDLPLIWCVLGGTGTGKSTIFNSIVSSNISSVGVKRPCTMSAIILAHNIYGKAIFQAPVQFEGMNRQADLLLDSRHELQNVILIDTPDLDSVASENKLVAHRFFVLSDVVIFVTSQEKYGDLVCRQMLEEVNLWGKEIVLVMNKVTSTDAYEEYKEFTKTLGANNEPIVIPRLHGIPALIDGFRDNQQIGTLLFNPPKSAINLKIKNNEIDRLRSKTVSYIENLRSSFQMEFDRISLVNMAIREISTAIELDLNRQLDAIVSQDVEKQIRSRLQALLRKYDILFLPRLMLRNAFKTMFSYFSELFFSKAQTEDSHQDDKDIRFEDFSGVESIAPLGPLDMSVTNLNLRIAELLASSDGYDDLRLIALKDVQRFDYNTIRSMYEEAFPGLENLLETEFEKIRQGLTRYDEIKLYGSYTLWALLLVTFEIVIGGGLTLLDLLLNSVIVPFIPKWLLDLKILDILRSIAQKVDAEHKSCLRNILFRQAELYTELFASLTPDEKAISEIEHLRPRIMKMQA